MVVARNKGVVPSKVKQEVNCPKGRGDLGIFAKMIESIETNLPLSMQNKARETARTFLPAKTPEA